MDGFLELQRLLLGSLVSLLATAGLVGMAVYGLACAVFLGLDRGLNGRRDSSGAVRRGPGR